MSSKSVRIAALVDECPAQGHNRHYAGYFACFNQQRFFEAHEVLEVLWLPQRHAHNGRFYKGLIQLAGAFVHVQKNRPNPAVSLLKLAQANLEGYGPIHESLDVGQVLDLIRNWLTRIDPSRSCAPLTPETAPRLGLS